MNCSSALGRRRFSSTDRPLMQFQHNPTYFIKSNITTYYFNYCCLMAESRFFKARLLERWRESLLRKTQGWLLKHPWPKIKLRSCSESTAMWQSCLHTEMWTPWRGPYTLYECLPTPSRETSAAVTPRLPWPCPTTSSLPSPSPPGRPAYLRPPTSTRSPPWLLHRLSDAQLLLIINSTICSWASLGPGGGKGVVKLKTRRKQKW